VGVAEVSLSCRVLTDPEEDRMVRALLIGMLRERERGGSHT
jgi:hypothetical protein